jgi:ABC-type branched-subunit amino acid transport system permease subunit
MSVGTSTFTALAAALLATLGWWVCKRLAAPEWVSMLVFGVLLVLVMLVGPLINLP